MSLCPKNVVAWKKLRGKMQLDVVLTPSPVLCCLPKPGLGSLRRAEIQSLDLSGLCQMSLQKEIVEDQGFQPFDRYKSASAQELVPQS